MDFVHRRVASGNLRVRVVLLVLHQSLGVAVGEYALGRVWGLGL